LTTREHQILQLVALGYSQREIGEQLFIAPATVRNHLAHARAKLKVHSSLQAVYMALQYQWIDFPRSVN